MARVVILGDGGHARALTGIWDVPRLGIRDPVPDDARVVIGIGDIETRKKLFERYQSRVEGALGTGAVILSESIGTGVQVMSGAVIQPGCVIGDNVLVNTGATIDHDCNIGPHCHIAPGAVLCGNVTLGESCFIGAGSIIVQGVTLEPHTFVPAGTLVVGQDDLRRPLRVVRDRETETVVGKDVG